MCGSNDALESIVGDIVDSGFHIHKDLGPGLLETVYEAVLARTLEDKGFLVERQKPVRIEYAGLSFNEGFREDLLVENQVLVELKSSERFHPVHSKQVLTCLRLLDLPLGLLINFGAPMFKQGVKRVVNNLQYNFAPSADTWLLHYPHFRRPWRSRLCVRP